MALTYPRLTATVLAAFLRPVIKPVSCWTTGVHLSQFRCLHATIDNFSNTRLLCEQWDNSTTKFPASATKCHSSLACRKMESTRIRDRSEPENPFENSLVFGEASSKLHNIRPKETHSTVLVEGNIGCGKAQLLNYFRKLDSAVEICEEPIELWRNKDGQNLLDLLYKDPKANSYKFQKYVLETMMDLHEAGLDKPVSLLERSVHSARYVFIENLHRNKMLSDDEYKKLDGQFKGYLDGSRHSLVDLIVYIRTSPEVVHKRIMQRKRAEEQAISVEYLTQLHKLHEDWLCEKKFPVPAPVLTINGDLPLQEVITDIERRKNEILFGWGSTTSQCFPVQPTENAMSH